MPVSAGVRAAILRQAAGRIVVKPGLIRNHGLSVGLGVRIPPWNAVAVCVCCCLCFPRVSSHSIILRRGVEFNGEMDVYTNVDGNGN